MAHINLNQYLYLQDSPIHGKGVFARKDIPKGTEVIQYTGELISKAESDRRAERIRKKGARAGSGAVYLFTVNDKYDIDGDVPENYARFINHACVTNCEAVNIDDEIWIETTRKVKKGDELHYDYGFDYAGWEEHPCLCGRRQCCGFIIAEKYRPRMMKTRKYQQLRQESK